jgi:hypothetical protein
MGHLLAAAGATYLDIAIAQAGSRCGFYFEEDVEMRRPDPRSPLKGSLGEHVELSGHRKNTIPYWHRRASGK